MEQAETNKILAGVFGEPHTKSDGTVGGIPVILRTLYDAELSSALRKSLAHASIEFQLFLIKRWKLAYSLVSINEVPFPETVEERFKLIAGGDTDEEKGWPNYFVEQVYSLYEDACNEESELVDSLKKSTGIDET